MKTFFIYIIFLLIIQVNYAQESIELLFDNEQEVYFRFEKKAAFNLTELTKNLFISNVTDDSVYSYANKEGFRYFLSLDIQYEILPHPGDVINPKMKSSSRKQNQWDYYPPYYEYVDMMYEFAETYPEICRIVNAGKSVLGRDILFVVISDNVTTREAEPSVMYSSTMHGNELVGFVLMLRFIDYLLTNYGSNERITNLINNQEIWINPHANPDGTYRDNDSTITSARRTNVNGVDLNRNFPDPWIGDHPDGRDWQPETLVMMDVFSMRNFALSANFHTGTEVVNYPYDGIPDDHADWEWFSKISHLYADTTHTYSVGTSYMKNFNNGVTNGYDWYPVFGSRQAYATCLGFGREVTIEISNAFIVPGEDLPRFWDYNRAAFITYLEQALYGVQGLVTDDDLNTLKAKIEIAGHDKDSSFVYSDSTTGFYARFLSEGVYDLTFSAPGYETQIIDSVVVEENTLTKLDVILHSIVPVEFLSFEASYADNHVLLEWSTATEINNLGFEIQKCVYDTWSTIGFVNGSGTTTEKVYYAFTDDSNDIGIPRYRLKQIDFDGTYAFSDVISLAKYYPADFSLSSNFPEPFNPVTTVVLRTPYDVTGELSLYSVLGKKIRILKKGTFHQGVEEFQVDGIDLSSGLYFIKFESSLFNAIEKIQLVK